MINPETEQFLRLEDGYRRINREAFSIRPVVCRRTRRRVWRRLSGRAFFALDAALQPCGRIRRPSTRLGARRRLHHAAAQRNATRRNVAGFPKEKPAFSLDSRPPIVVAVKGGQNAELPRQEPGAGFGREGSEPRRAPAAVYEAWCAYSARPSFTPPEPPGRQGGRRYAVASWRPGSHQARRR